MKKVKIGRNEPCPCGSGKKYKKCHGATNVVELSVAPYNAELDRLHGGLIDFAVAEYQTKLGEVFDRYKQPQLMEDKEHFDIYLSGLTAWAILYEPIDQGRTVFEMYYKKMEKKIKHERVRRAFLSWGDATPSLYETLNVTEGIAKIQDVHTKEEYDLQLRNAQLHEGSLLIGILLPFVQQHEFLFATLELNVGKDQLKDLTAKLDENGFKVNYPEILAEALTTEVPSVDLEWENPMDETVAELFKEHSQEKGADEKVISTGVLLWKVFTSKQKPSYRKPDGYAAALDYFIQRDVLGSQTQSQKDLATEYGTSPNSISKYAKNMADVLEDEIGELRDAVLEASK